MTSEMMRIDGLFTRKMRLEKGCWNLPNIRKQALPENKIELIACSDTKSDDHNNTEKGVHFFVDDYRFESIYRTPEKSLRKFAQYSFMLTPDFSLYADMPMWRQLESVAKNRWCGAWWQEHGLTVIPTISWSNYQSFSFCFDGIEMGSNVAVSTVGCSRSKLAFMRGYDAMMERLCPQTVICYGRPFKEMRGDVVRVDYTYLRKAVH